MVTIEDTKLTNSRKTTAQTCLRKHFYAYELGIRREVDAVPLRMGSAIHVGLELCGKGKSTDDAILGALLGYDESQPEGVSAEGHAGWLIEREVIGRLLAGYFWRWSEADKGIQIFACEQEFNLPIVNPDSGRSSRTFTVAGKIDQIAKRGDRVFIREHKTSGQDIAPDADYWKRLRIDSQVSTYWLAALELGHVVEGIEYDVIRKPGIRPKKLTQAETAKFVNGGGIYYGEKFVIEVTDKDPLALLIAGDQAEIDNSGKLPTVRETPRMYGARLSADITDRPDYYFARRDIPRIQADLDEARYELWQMAKLLRECQKHDRWPRSTTACVGFGRCAYFDLCTNGFDPESGIVPEGYMQVATVHPELVA